MPWEKEAGKWYAKCVGEKGHFYHQSLLIPKALSLLALKKGESVLDLGCGQGVFARSLSKGVEYWGVDASRSLIAEARRITKREHTHFVIADVTAPLSIEKRDFTSALFLLSLQNIASAEKALCIAASHLSEKGRLLLVLNHPCFRIPRQSSWEIDAAAKLQYRRINTYMSPQSIPIQTHPGKGECIETTHSYHHPLSHYSRFLHDAGFVVTVIEEWCSEKKSEGRKARMEDRARREIPLFLALLCVKEKTV